MAQGTGAAAPRIEDRSEEVKAPERQDHALRGLARLHLIMGEQCNARCSMCYQVDFSHKSNMPRVLYAERLLPAYEVVETVKIQGGEPTVMRNCRELVDLLSLRPRVRISMSTNGIRMEGFWTERLLAQGGRVDVSINAAGPEAYARIVRYGDYQRVLRNVAALTTGRGGQRQPQVAISAVILKENFPELHRLIELGAELGVDAVKLGIDPVLSFSGLPPREEILAELERVEEARVRTGMPVEGLDGFRKRFVPTAEPVRVLCGPCRVPDYNLVVDAKGMVRGCVRTWASLGNLYESTIEEIWNGESALALREALARKDHSGCEAWCPENRDPSRAARLRKYAFYASKDPSFFAKKVQHKIQQLRGKPN